MRPLVFDATPLIYLGKVKLLDNLGHFPEDKYATESVFREVVDRGKERGEPEAFTIENIVEKGIIKIKNPHNKSYIKHLLNNPKIHLGDADTLALSREIDGIALMDDEEARGMAEIEGIVHHGTIYLLLRMMKLKILTKKETLESLNNMIHHGWRCSTELYADILKTIKE